MGFLDNMSKLMEMKQRMDETKRHLDSMEIIAENDYVKIVATGNRKIKNITIINTDNIEVLQQKLQDAINEALEKADAMMQSEMLGATKDMLPGM